MLQQNGVPTQFYENNFSIKVIVGLNSYEREAPQDIIVEYKVSVLKHADEENLHTEMREKIREFFNKTQPLLLEYSVYYLAVCIRENIAGIGDVSITIKKPNAIDIASYSFAKIIVEE